VTGGAVGDAASALVETELSAAANEYWRPGGEPEGARLGGAQAKLLGERGADFRHHESVGTDAQGGPHPFDRNRPGRVDLRRRE
jgi:hypothetical protein